MKLAVCLAALLCGNLSTSDSASPPPARVQVAADRRFSELRKEILTRVQKGELPSVSIAAIKDGAILWKESIGWSDKENRIAATPGTPYGLASLGKSVTATAVMVLAKQGKVDLDAPISRYLGGAPLNVFEGQPDQVTVRRVLNMTAAVPHGLMVYHGMQQLATDDLVRNRGLVVFPPGEVYLYSNFSYVLLEKAIEAASGKSYPEFLASEVFAPLGMTDSFVKTTEETGAAIRYAADGSRLAPDSMFPRNSLAMYASLDDLLDYAMLHLRARQLKGLRILDDKALEQMHRLRGEAPHSLLALGFGSIDLDENRLWLLTNGRAGGIQATLSIIPSEGLAVVCLINSSGQTADDLAFRVTDILASGFLARVQQLIGEHEAWAEQSYKPVSELLGEWRGSIAAKGGDVPLRLLFQPDGDIHVQVGDQIETILSGVAYREGLLSGSFLAELPMEEAAGHPHKVTLSLQLKGDHLSGFATSDFTNEKGRFSLAAYVRLDNASDAGTTPQIP